jgi:hypothetical protein
METEPELLTADHRHPEGAVTVTLPDPPVLPSDAPVDEREYVQAIPLSVTVKVCEAMVKVPVWPLIPESAVAEYPTDPFPLPLAPEVTLRKGELLAAVQVHPVGAVTFTDPGPPWLPTVALVDESENVQAIPPSLKVNVCPAIVSVPLWPVMVLSGVTE